MVSHLATVYQDTCHLFVKIALVATLVYHLQHAALTVVVMGILIAMYQGHVIPLQATALFVLIMQLV